MTFFSILCALLIEQLKPLRADNQIYAEIKRLAMRIEAWFNAGQVSHGRLGWFIMMGSLMLPTALIYGVLLHYVWVFAAFAVLYGFCETMNGNWSQLDMTSELHASATQASFALTAFWGMVTVGRVLFAMIARWFPPQRTYHVLPFLLAIMFVVIAVLPTGAQAVGILAFALAGFGCSALLPLTISFGEEQLLSMGASVAGAVIAFYQMGYGIAAFGTGPLVDAGVSLRTLFVAGAVVAVVMGGLSFALARRSPAEVMVRASTS